MTTHAERPHADIDFDLMYRDEILDVAAHDLTAVARDRYLTADRGERSFDFAEDLAEILAQVSDNVGGPDELFYGQEITTNVAAVLALRPERAPARSASDLGRPSIGAAVDVLTMLGRDITIADVYGNSSESFADDLAMILEHVSTNLGGLGELFAGQDITPNTALVADLIGAEIPDQRPERRSEPVRLPLYIDSLFEEFGLWDKFRSEILDLSVRERTPGLPGDERRQAATMMRELRDLYAADKATYINNYTARAKLIAHSHGIHAPVEVVAIHDHTDTREIARDPLTHELHNELVQGTVVPATGKAPAQHPGQKPADVAPSYTARAGDAPGMKQTASMQPPQHRRIGSGLSM